MESSEHKKEVEKENSDKKQDKVLDSSKETAETPKVEKESKEENKVEGKKEKVTEKEEKHESESLKNHEKESKRVEKRDKNEREMKKKNEERMERKEEKKEHHESHKNEPHEKHKPYHRTSLKQSIRNFYVYHYKSVLLMSFSLVVIMALVLVLLPMHRGYLLNRDISLKGGVVVTLPLSNADDFNLAVKTFKSKYPNKDITIRLLGSTERSISVETSDLNKTQILSTLSTIPEFKSAIDNKDFTFVTVGSALGSSFFKQTIKALIWSFILMSVVVLIYFRNFVPSLFVSWNAFSDLLETISLLVIINMKFSTASIAALLMLIGYSVDTNVLLTSRVLRAPKERVVELIFNSMKTGLSMTGTTVITTFFAFLVTQSLVIKQIMFILTIGMVFDTINTWMFNAPLLRGYLEKKQRAHIK